MDDHLIHEPRIRRGRRPRVPGLGTAEPHGPHGPAGEATAGPATLPPPRREADEAAARD
jgi:hypothetical protein